MSLTRVVPASVPSLFHNSQPDTPSLPEKYRAPVNVAKRTFTGQTRDAVKASDVLDQHRAGLGAVALPQRRPSVDAVVGREDQPAIHVGQIAGVGDVGNVAAVVARGAARSDIFDEGGAGGGAVALPQLNAMLSIVGREE